MLRALVANAFDLRFRLKARGHFDLFFLDAPVHEFGTDAESITGHFHAGALPVHGVRALDLRRLVRVE